MILAVADTTILSNFAPLGHDDRCGVSEPEVLAELVSLSLSFDTASHRRLRGTADLSFAPLEGIIGCPTLLVSGLEIRRG